MAALQSSAAAIFWPGDALVVQQDGGPLLARQALQRLSDLGYPRRPLRPWHCGRRCPDRPSISCERVIDRLCLLGGPSRIVEHVHQHPIEPPRVCNDRPARVCASPRLSHDGLQVEVPCAIVRGEPQELCVMLSVELAEPAQRGQRVWEAGRSLRRVVPGRVHIAPRSRGRGREPDPPLRAVRAYLAHLATGGQVADNGSQSLLFTLGSAPRRDLLRARCHSATAEEDGRSGNRVYHP